jgi:hypothetical protein
VTEDERLEADTVRREAERAEAEDALLRWEEEDVQRRKRRRFRGGRDDA